MAAEGFKALKNKIHHDLANDRALKVEEAKVLYLRLKDKPYGDSTFSQAFLDDFAALKEAGITHPDVEKIRKLLETE